MNSEEITVDHARSMSPPRWNPGGSTVDHSQSTVRNSGSKKLLADQTESTTMSKEKSTTAEPNITSKEELEVINLSDDPDITKPISISKSLSAKERKCLIDLLHEYKDVFAWDYHEMPAGDRPGASGSFFELEPGTRPVHPRCVKHAGQEKERADQMLVTFEKGMSKDEFPLPNMDLLIDSAAGHAMFSFMDGFSGYNQIRMSTRDAEKTAFRTPIGNFYYTVMPFGLKNAGATYQRTMTAMFHDMMHKEIEDYVEHSGEVQEKGGSSWNLKKGGSSLVWQQRVPFFPRRAFEKIQQIMTKLPTVCAPVPGRPLRLYLASNSEAIGGLVAQEDEEGTERPIYYVSRALKDAETRYSGAERACLALIYASQRLRHYFLAHKIQLITKSHPIRSLLHRPVLSGRLAQWLLQLSQYEITTETPTPTIKSQAIADLLAQFPGEDIAHQSRMNSSGAGIVLAREDGKTIAKSFKLDFPCSNNASEYEAYITGLVIAHEMGIKHLRVIGDSNLIICQTKGEFSLKEPSLALYRALAQKLEEEFDTFEISHAMRCENRYADALATLGSQVSFEGSKVDVTIDKRSMPITDLLREKFKEPNLDAEDWRTPIKAKLVAPEGVADLKVLKDYVLIAGDLYRRLPGGVLARCVNLQEAAKKLTEHQHESDQIYATFVSSDWRTPFLEYLIENILPQTSQAAVRIKKLATRYFVEGGILFRKGFHGDPLRCLSLAESQTVMKEAHSGECGEHQGKKRFLQNMATPWPFHTWGLDLIGPINPASGGYIWILVATEYFSKWVEAIPLRKATGAAVANFIREHIITSTADPRLITLKAMDRRRQLIACLLRILSKMVFDYGKGWNSHLADTLWAYRGSTKTATGFTPFSLVYGTDAISPTELLVPSPRILHGMDLEADADICAEARVADLEGLEEARELAQARSLRYHQKLADAYEKTLQTRIFAKGQMVLKTVDPCEKRSPLAVQICTKLGGAILNP
uniref:Uncharacterized protein n=1 Tax=Fagus sylvatica TaxID=28930 RepID=A0A2N9GX94_FAGSY